MKKPMITTKELAEAGDLLAVLDDAEAKAWQDYMAAIEKFKAETKLQQLLVEETEEKWTKAFATLKNFQKAGATTLNLAHAKSKDAHCHTCDFKMAGGAKLRLCPICGSDRWYKTKL